MHSLKKYIAESVHTYNYTIKIAGNVDKNFLDMFKFNLKKFDPIKISDPVSTPIQKSPYGFPDLENEPVHIIKAEFRYPATEPMIQQIAQLLGYNVNYVRVIGTKFDDSIDSEATGYANEADHSPLLNHTELEEQPGAKEAAKAYGNSYLDSIKDQTKDDKIAIPYSSTEMPKAAFDPFKPETLMATMGKESPMTHITRPAKPRTGAMGGK
jgi:hypothetical protein